MSSFQVAAMSMLAGGAGGFYGGYRTFASDEEKKVVRTSMKVVAAVAVLSCISGVLLMRRTSNSDKY